MPPLRHITNLFRGRPAVEPAEADRYGAAVQPLLQDLYELFVRWRQDLELDSPEEGLANAASIQRWQAASIRDQLVAVERPVAFSKLHDDLGTIALDTARAAQLLSNGYRFHSSRARCDGHALMLTAEARLDALLRALADYGVSVEHAAHDAAGSGQ